MKLGLIESSPANKTQTCGRERGIIGKGFWLRIYRTYGKYGMTKKRLKTGRHKRRSRTPIQGKSGLTREAYALQCAREEATIRATRKGVGTAAALKGGNRLGTASKKKDKKERCKRRGMGRHCSKPRGRKLAKCLLKRLRTRKKWARSLRKGTTSFIGSQEKDSS